MSATLQGLHQMKVVAILSALTRLGTSFTMVAVLLVGGGLIGVAVGVVAVSGLLLVLTALLLFRLVPLTPRMERVACRTLVLGGLPFFVSQGAFTVSGQVDGLLLSFLSNDATVGWYAAAYRIITVPGFVPGIILTVMLPGLSALARDSAAFNPIARRAMQLALLATVPMALGIILLADKLIAMLNYPPEFANAVAPMVLLAPHIPLAAFNTIVGTVMAARDRQRRWAILAMIAAAFTPLANFVAIPYAQATFGNGAIGAATITTLTEVAILLAGSAAA